MAITDGWYHNDWWLDNWFPKDWWTEYGTASATAAASTVATLQEAVYVFMKADTLVHDQVADRVHWVDAPQQQIMPYVSYFVVSDPHDPESFGELGAGQARVQFNVYDDNPYRSSTIAKTLRKRLHKYGSTTMGGKSVQSILCGGVLSFKVPDHDMYQGTFDAMVNYYD